MHGKCEDECAGGECTYKCICDPGWSQEKGDRKTPCDKEKVDCKGRWEFGICEASCTRKGTYIVTRPKEGSGQECPADHGDQEEHDCEDVSDGYCTDCTGRDCNGQGACTEGVGCKCDEPYEGLNCEMKMDDCARKQCAGHGACVGDSCACYHGWEGDKCTKDPCSSCPKGQGQCGSATGGRCLCEPGFATYGDTHEKCNWDIAAQQDCQGEFGDWSMCRACFKKRSYKIIQEASGVGSKECKYKDGEEQEQRCGQPGSPECCSITEDMCENGALNADDCLCECTGDWRGELCNVQEQELGGVQSATQKFTDADMKIEAVDGNDFYGDVDIDSSPDGVTIGPDGKPIQPSFFSKISKWVWIGIGGGVLLIIIGIVGLKLWKKRKARLARQAMMGVRY